MTESGAMLDHRLRALVLGSEPFASLDRNPAAEIALAIAQRSSAELAIEGATLPVSYERLPKHIGELVAARKADIVLGLGLFVGAATIRVESTAINRADFGVSDNEGRFIRDEPLISNGPPARMTPYRAEDVAAAIRAQGIPARASHFAGTHLCNLVLYHLLGLSGDKTIAGFVHLPLLPEQVAALMTESTRDAPRRMPFSPELPSMSRDQQMAAVATALQTLATILRNRACPV